MPVYDFECSNHGSRPYSFEERLSLEDYKKTPKCPKCNKKKYVKKVIKSTVPVSQSWKTF